MRIAIMGYSGSGKSTLAKALGQRMGFPVIHLDQLHFRQGWEERPDQVAIFLLQPWLAEPNWIIDGNYHSLGYEERISLADQIIILRFPRLTCLCRAFGRYRKFRGQTRPDMSPGCPEKFDLAFIWWILHQGRNRRMRNRYQALVERFPEKCMVFRSQKQINAYLKTLTTTADGQ